MVHASSILAAVLSCSSFLSVSASPVDVEQRAPNGGALDAINWRGTVEAGKPPVYLSGRSFEVCFIPLSPLLATKILY